MKIACVDKTASDRLRLQRYVDGAFEDSRSLLGHVRWATTLPCTLSELHFQKDFDVVIFGPGFALEERLRACRDLQVDRPDVELILLLEPQQFDLGTLRRFERFTKDIHCIADPPTRLLFSLSQTQAKKDEGLPGQIVTVKGAKGGVGATTIVSGMAHAAQAIGKSAVVIDLSQHSVFSRYISAPRWRSHDFTSDLEEGTLPNTDVVRRYIATAPNGINVLLPPAGGTDVRELWLRDTERFEFSLHIVEALQKLYDLVLIDMAQVEGVLPFALQTRATFRCIVTSNDPSSVHLATHALEEAKQIPGPGQCALVTNFIDPQGLKHDDIVTILSGQNSLSESARPCGSVPHDTTGRFWAGTGNSFYTESRLSTQRALEQILLNLDRYTGLEWKPLGGWTKQARRSVSRWNISLPWQRALKETKALPLLAAETSPSASAQAFVLGRENSAVLAPPSELNPQPASIEPEAEGALHYAPPTPYEQNDLRAVGER